jgi:hypothetical protein
MGELSGIPITLIGLRRLAFLDSRVYGTQMNSQFWLNLSAQTSLIRKGNSTNMWTPFDTGRLGVNDVRNKYHSDINISKPQRHTLYHVPS